MKCSAFATLATGNAWDDLLGLLLSLNKIHSDSVLYLYCDNEIRERVSLFSNYLSLTVHCKTSLEEFSGKSRALMEAEGSWLRFMMAKADVMLWALERQGDVLFIDCDIVVLKPIYIDEQQNPEIALSPHFIRQEFVDQYGLFNGGVFWSRSIEAVKRWKALMPESRYFDQACLEDLAHEFSCYLFDESHNLSWWRVYQSDRRPGDELNRLTVNSSGRLCIDDAEIHFVHTHFRVQSGTIGAFNREILRLAMRGSQTWLKILLLRLARGSFEVHLPSQPRTGIWNHKNDSFRELAVLWEEAGLCRITRSDENHCWFGFSGGVALYDRPTFEWWNSEIAEAELVLCGNVRPKNEKSIPWIFWPREPRAYNSFRENRTRSEKTTQTIFIGNVENGVQDRFRRPEDWKNVIEKFLLSEGKAHRYSQKQYLEELSSSRFGLCLRGYGAKCHREIELMGLGVIPMITNEVDFNSYANPPQGSQFVKLSDPSEVNAIVNSFDEGRLHEIASINEHWYDVNCSVEGSFLTTLFCIFGYGD